MVFLLYHNGFYVFCKPFDALLQHTLKNSSLWKIFSMCVWFETKSKWWIIILTLFKLIGIYTGEHIIGQLVFFKYDYTFLYFSIAKLIPFSVFYIRPKMFQKKKIGLYIWCFPPHYQWQKIVLIGVCKESVIYTYLYQSA